MTLYDKFGIIKTSAHHCVTTEGGQMSASNREEAMTDLDLPEPFDNYSSGIDPRLRPLTDLQIDTLMGNLHSSRVSHRAQGGRQLSFLEAHDVRATLTRVFGFGGFDIETIEAKVIDISRAGADGVSGNYRVTTMARTQITIHQTGAVFSDVAACTQTGPALGDVLDFSLKTSASDSMKRCAVNLGTQFGLSLYVDGATQDQVRIIVAPDQVRMPQPPPPDPQVDEQLARAAGGVRSEQ